MVLVGGRGAFAASRKPSNPKALHPGGFPARPPRPPTIVPSRPGLAGRQLGLLIPEIWNAHALIDHVI